MMSGGTCIPEIKSRIGKKNKKTTYSSFSAHVRNRVLEYLIEPALLYDSGSGNVGEQMKDLQAMKMRFPKQMLQIP